MFCSNCGKQLDDTQKFCQYCGTENLASSNTQIIEQTYNPMIINEQAQNHSFNRDVLNNYLYNVRVLEVAKSNLLKLKDDTLCRIEGLGIPQFYNGAFGYNNTNWSAFDDKGLGAVWGLVAVAFFAVLIFGKLICWIFECEFTFFGILMALIIIFAVGFTIYDFYDSGKKDDEHTQLMKEDDKRVKIENTERERLISEEIPNIENEIETVERMLTEAYSINIIPLKFRNIYAAYFLYDYISTSTATLNEALFACDLNTIQEKLDTIIEQQQEIIMELAYSNALNQQVIQQNEQILQHAIATENNTALAAQYSKVAATNTGVTAYIQTCEYLRR